MPTGPELCSALAPLEPGAISDEQLLEVLAAQWRQLSYQQSQVWALMAEIGSRDPMAVIPGAAAWTPDQVFDSAVDEIRAELRLTRRSARQELEYADAVTALPRVAEALQSGLIDRRRAVVLADGCYDLTAEQASSLLDEVLADAAAVSATTLAQRVRRVAIALDPGWAERRYREAVRERRVIGYLNEDGSATVSGQRLSAEQAAAACARIDMLAASAKRAGANARLDHLRADLFLGLLEGRFHGLHETAIVAELLRQYPRNDESPKTESIIELADRENMVQSGTAADFPHAQRGLELRVGLGTLLGLDEQPGEIAGWGAITADLARKVVARQRRSEWRFAIVDEHGHLLFDGITRRRPSCVDESTAQADGGVVELHVPVTLLGNPDLARQHPNWAGVLADLARQHRKNQRPAQDPTARFPGRALRRHSQINYQHCVFPSCRRPATGSDQDHLRDHARGGPTSAENLAPGCRHDHINKTTRGRRPIRLAERTFVWVSPLGRRHLVRVPAVAPPLPPPRPRPPDSAPETDGTSAADDARELGAPTFTPKTQRGRPLAPPSAYGEHHPPTGPEPDRQRPPF
jgi:hypothetical protein